MSKNMNVPKLRFKEFSGEWEERNFGDIYTFLQTNSFSRALLNYENGKVKNIHYGDIHTKFKSNFHIENENVPYINSEVDISKIKDENYCKEKDLVIADASEDYKDIGKAIEIINLNDEKLLAGLHTYIARDEKNVMVKGFSGYFMQIHNVRLQMMKLATGISVLGISKTNLSKIKLNLPSKQEQEKIASFLTSVDTKIEQLIKKEQLLQKYKKGVMQKIFNQEIRFKADDGSEFEEWEEKKISDMFDVTRGYVLAVAKMSEQKTEEFQYPVYSSQTKNKGLTGYFNEYLYEGSITWTTDGANAGDVNFRKGKFYCTNVCGVLKSNKGYANECIAQILNSVTKRYVSYVGNPKLMNNTMGTIKIKIPSSIEEQNKIANFLSSIDTKIEQVQKQLESSKEFKKALLQQMFI